MNESALKVILELGPKYGVDLWKHVQRRRDTREGWLDCSDISIRIYSDVEYRVKPRTHIVNGIECPAPMICAPDIGSRFWVLDLLNPKCVQCYINATGSDFVYTQVRMGNCFHTKEDALANFYAHYPHMRPEAE